VAFVRSDLGVYGYAIPWQRKLSVSLLRFSCAASSRSLERLKLCSYVWCIRSFSSYQNSLGRSDVDIHIYRYTACMHYENTMMCRHAFKSVLCEKPMAMNASRLNDQPCSKRKNHTMQGFGPVYSCYSKVLDRRQKADRCLFLMWKQILDLESVRLQKPVARSTD
jgi:hypothetical protein